LDASRYPLTIGNSSTSKAGTEQEEAIKKEARKRKEMETKLFQDIQVLEKKEKLRLEVETRRMEQQRMKKDLDAYVSEEQRLKDQTRARNRIHMEGVLRQMKEEPRLLAKTGVAVISSGQ
jgi:hypothetical protein